jgi:TetR/AcrR family transcriptional repressor of bet genes
LSPKSVGGSAKPVERLSRARQRLKLIDACITALHQFGPSRTTIDKVVSIADMSPGIVNFYFETKAALLVAALEHLAVEFETSVLEPLATLRSTPMLALERLIELYLAPNLASPRKVSVWYSFWGESSSRREYSTICGKRDEAFAVLVQDLVARVIAETGLSHLDADAVALGLIGCLEMMWQEIAFQDETDVNRETAKARCRAYLRSVFYPAGAARGQPAPDPRPIASSIMPDEVFRAEVAMFRRYWQFGCAASEIPEAGDYVAWESAAGRTLILRRDDGEIRAFVNTCLRRPHALVASGSGQKRGEIVCSADGHVYGLDGISRSGDGTLAPLHLSGGAETIWVINRQNGMPPAPSFAFDAFAPLGSWHAFDIQADWKLVVEHWADAYFDTSARAFALVEGINTIDLENNSVVQTRALKQAGSGFSRRCYFHLSSRSASAMVERRLVMPNLFVEIRPDGATIRQVLPLGPRRSRVHVRRYKTRATDRVARATCYLIARLERVWEREDLQAIESTQTGMDWPDTKASPAQGITAKIRHWLQAAIPNVQER